jgi:hypothetical protein
VSALCRKISTEDIHEKDEFVSRIMQRCADTVFFIDAPTAAPPQHTTQVGRVRCTLSSFIYVLMLCNLRAGIPSSKNYTNWLCEKLIYYTISATRSRTTEHGGYYQLR